MLLYYFQSVILLFIPIIATAQSWQEDPKLRTTLADKRIVALGESLHAVEEFSVYKLEWIKYLHEELGYNVLALEYGLGDAFLTGYQREKWSAETMLDMSLYPCWQTETNLELMTYLKEHPELILVGFDMQGERIEGEKPSFLEDFLKPLKHKKWAKNAIAIENKFHEGETTVEDYETILKQVNSNLRKFKKHHSENYIRYAQFFLASRIATHQQPIIPNVGYGNRDSLMAANIHYILEELYPNEKMIIWAHNVHINTTSQVRSKYLVQDMGVRLEGYYGDDYYVVGFFNSLGKAMHQPWGYEYTFEEEKLADTSLQYYLLDRFSDQETAFLQITDFREEEDYQWLFEEVENDTTGGFSAKYYGRIEMINLADNYDGIFWVKTASIPVFVE